MIWRARVALTQRLGVIIVVGAIAVLPASAQETNAYRYDALGRLVKVQTAIPDSSVETAYTYDQAGNRANVTVATSGPVVLNGDFEDPGIGTQNYAYLPAARSLTFSGNAGIAADGSAWNFPSSWHGNQVAFIQSGAKGISFVQLKAINLIVGRRYVFAFAAARRPGYPENAMRIFIDTNLVWDGPPETEAKFSPHPTQAFTATATTATIRFQTTPTPYDSSSGIDAVSIQEVNY